MNDDPDDMTAPTTIILNAKAWEAFMAELDQPPKFHARLAALLASMPPWDNEADAVPSTNGARLKRRDRQVYRASDVPDDLLAAIEATEPSAESEEVERKLAGKHR